jgi:hypothetical protein
MLGACVLATLAVALRLRKLQPRGLP